MPCVICGKSQELNVYGKLTKCNTCGLIYYNKYSGSIDVKSLYQEGYFTGEEYLDYKKDKIIIQKNFSFRLREIQAYVKDGSLFEIGCAYGFFLELAQKYFKVEGIDIALIPTLFASKDLCLDVSATNYLDFYLPDKKDVICVWDTIEHLEKPHEFIKKINLELNDGGYLFLTTGDIGSMLAKIRGEKWRMIHPPTHLFYFSKNTITRLLNQHGFKVISIRYPGVYRSLKQIVWSLFFANRVYPDYFEKIINKIDFPVYINTFDIMMVVARKI